MPGYTEIFFYLFEVKRKAPMKKFASLAYLLLVLESASADEQSKHNFKPREGYVPNAETAIRIATAIWEPIYGKEQIASQKPYAAVLKDGVWVVQGTLQAPPGKIAVGGTPIAEISKEDGKVIRVSHGK